MTDTDPNDTHYQNNYSDESFWNKLSGYARSAGRDVVEKALILHYAAQRDATPGWARASVYAALGYFIAPLDAIVDLTPAVGYADDLGVLVLALATVAHYINDDVRERAATRAQAWFGAPGGDSKHDRLTE